MIKSFLLGLTLLVGPCFSQNNPGQAVNSVALPPPDPIFGLLFYDGSNNLISVCTSLQLQPVITYFLKSDATLTNIVVSSGTATATTASAHKYYAGARFTISGSATSALNENVTITSVGSTTLVFTSSAADGTYTDTGLSMATRQARTSDSKWAVQRLPNSSGNLTAFYWALPTPLIAAGSRPPMNAKCDDRASY